MINSELVVVVVVAGGGGSGGGGNGGGDERVTSEVCESMRLLEDSLPLTNSLDASPYTCTVAVQIITLSLIYFLSRSLSLRVGPLSIRRHLAYKLTSPLTW